MTDAAAPFLPGYLPYLLRQADQTLSGPFYAVLNDNEISRSEWRVLSVLQERGELSVVELAAAALSPQPTVTHALRRLEKRGLILRTLGTEDKRQRFISVTTSGAALASALMAEATQLQAAALENVGDISHLIVQLEHLTTSVENHVQSTIAAQTDDQQRAG